MNFTDLLHSMNSNDIVISGHTDTVGEKDYNYKLALERAQTALQILVANGANPAKRHSGGRFNQ